MKVLWIFVFISSAVAADVYPLPQSKEILKTVYEWKYFDYLWEYPGQKEEYIRSGRYDPKKMVSVDVDQSRNERTFVTVMRTAGVPASLHIVSYKNGESGPLLQPYPNWSWYKEERKCSGITNVHRIAIDDCNNRLWALDTGIIDGKHVCQEKLFVFDLKKNELLFWKAIPHDAARNRAGEGQLDTLIIGVEGNRCENTTVYLADALSKSLVIFKDDQFIRVNDEVFECDERDASFDIAGEQFHMTNGLSIALSPFYNKNHYLAFRPLASRSIYAADTQELKNLGDNRKINYVRGTDLLPSPASAMLFSLEGTLLYGLPHEMAIGCYNIHRPPRSENFKIAVQDDERLQFISGMKLLKSITFMGDTLLVMSNRLQKIHAGTMDFNEINFRIMKVDLDHITAETACGRSREKEE